MSRITNIFNRKVEVPVANTVNNSGHPAYTKDLKEQYVQMLMTNTFGDTFYVKSNDLINEAVSLTTKMLETDSEFAAKALVYARTQGYMRSTTIYGLARLSCFNTALFKAVFEQVIKTPDDLMDFMSVVKSLRGNEGGRAIKTTVASWIAKYLSPYWAIKYGAEKSGNYSLKDIIVLTHPVIKDPTVNESVRYLLKGSVPEDGQIAEFEKLKKVTTNKEKIDCIIKGKLPHEVATTFAGKNKEIWRAIVRWMPIMALVRNLATIERIGIADEVLPIIAEKLTNKEVIERSKIFPYTFYDAYKEVCHAGIKDALKTALDLSVNNIPDIKGKTLISLDVSGSMSGVNIEVASIFALALARKTNYSSIFHMFNSNLFEYNVSKVDSIISQLNTLKRPSGNTDTSLSLRWLIKNNIKVDNFIIVTDEQHNGSDTFAKALVDYKNAVNSQVKVTIVNVLPYTTNTILPSAMENVYKVHGWTDKILSFVAVASSGWKTLVDNISNINID
jgi:60 kDa SS-A/Ro ribonucleoprotein